MKIYIGADHRGFALKEQLKSHLREHEVIDEGAHRFNEEDDYPDFARKVSQNVATDKNARGIIICGSGVGVEVAGNKIKGARAGLALNPKQVKEATEADNINILALAADYTEPQDAKELVDAFLTSNYTPEPRRERRLKKIEELEK